MVLGDKDIETIRELLRLELGEGLTSIRSDLGDLRSSVEYVAGGLDRIEERLSLTDIQAARNYEHLQRQDERIAEATLGDRASSAIEPLPHSK